MPTDSTGPRKVAGSQVFRAASLIDRARDDVSFADAVVLARLVLEQGGGPVATRGKRAFTDTVTARRLARLELASLHENYGSAAGTRTSTAWMVEVSEPGRRLVESALDVE